MHVAHAGPAANVRRPKVTPAQDNTKHRRCTVASCEGSWHVYTHSHAQPDLTSIQVELPALPQTSSKQGLRPETHCSYRGIPGQTKSAVCRPRNVSQVGFVYKAQSSHHRVVYRRSPEKSARLLEHKALTSPHASPCRLAAARLPLGYLPCPQAPCGCPNALSGVCRPQQAMSPCT